MTATDIIIGICLGVISTSVLFAVQRVFDSIWIRMNQEAPFFRKG